MRETKSWLVLVLHLIGWVGGLSFFKPIIERSKARPKQFRITFDTQLKTTTLNNKYFLVCSTHISMLISVGISDHSLAYLTGVTGSCGSRSMCMWSIKRQNAARRSHDSSLSAIHLKHQNYYWIKIITQFFNYRKFYRASCKRHNINLRIRSTSNCLLMLLIARYCLSRHIRENRFNWYLKKKESKMRGQYSFYLELFPWLQKQNQILPLQYMYLKHSFTNTIIMNY